MVLRFELFRYTAIQCIACSLLRLMWVATILVMLEVSQNIIIMSDVGDLTDFTT